MAGEHAGRACGGLSLACCTKTGPERERQRGREEIERSCHSSGRMGAGCVVEIEPDCLLGPRPQPSTERGRRGGGTPRRDDPWGWSYADKLR